jgi:hypothetical protein
MVTKKGPSAPSELPVDQGLLDDVERQELTKQAQGAIDEGRKQKARDAFFDAELDRLRRGHIPEDQYVRVTIDAAPYVPFFMLDGVQYFPGYVYEVTRKQAVVLYEQMQRSFQHQDEIDGRSRFSPYRREQGMKIGHAQAGTTTRGASGGVIA